ncbi:MAG: lipid II flippase MurJ, partial [candidate division Zixibacteria bacterium]|nr:lipid II flippase MurJ [candidate division Zixibacteria bacterium]
DTANTSLALLHYSYGLIGFAAVRVTVPFFYAFGDSRLPMKISIVSVIINIVIYYPMIQILNFAGLAAATSTAGLVNFVLLLYYLPSKKIIINWGKLILNFARIVVASFLAVYAARLIPLGFGTGESLLVDRFLDLFVMFVCAALLYFLLCLIFRVKEVTALLRLIAGRKPVDK